MQNFYLQLKGRGEIEKVNVSFPLFIKTIPAAMRVNLRRIHGNRIVFTGTNKEFFSFNIYQYFHKCLKDGKVEILQRLTTDVHYPKPSDPLMLSGEYLKPTKDLYSHVSALPAETVMRQVFAWVGIGRVYRGAGGQLFLDRENEYETLIMKRFNEKGITHVGLSTGLGLVSLELSVSAHD